MNEVRLTGNIVADAETVGTAVSFRLAVSDGKNADGSKKTLFVTVKVFKCKCVNRLTKGTTIKVEGKLDISKYKENWYTSVIVFNWDGITFVENDREDYNSGYEEVPSF